MANIKIDEIKINGTASGEVYLDRPCVVLVIPLVV